MRKREKEGMIRALRQKVLERVDAAAAYGVRREAVTQEERIALSNASVSELVNLIGVERAQALEAATRASILEELLIREMERARDEKERAAREAAAQ